MRIVDAHHHLWDPTVTHYALLRRDGPLADLSRPFLAASFDAVAHEHGVGDAIAVEATSAGADPEVETRWLMREIAGSTVTSRAVVWAPVDEPRIGSYLDALFLGGQSTDGGSGRDEVDDPGDMGESGVGVRIVGARRSFEAVPDGFILSDAVVHGIREVARRGLVFDLVLFGTRLAEVVELVARLPEATFVLDHLGKPPIDRDLLPGWRRELTALARLPNVTAKVSGLASEAGGLAWAERVRPYVDHAVAAFGWRRLMFASDWPICERAGGYRRWLDFLMDISESADASERQDFFAGTAERVYAGRRRVSVSPETSGKVVELP